MTQFIAGNDCLVESLILAKKVVAANELAIQKLLPAEEKRKYARSCLSVNDKWAVVDDGINFVIPNEESLGSMGFDLHHRIEHGNYVLLFGDFDDNKCDEELGVVILNRHLEY